MKRFNFRLKKVLKHREIVENLKKEKLGKAKSELNRERDLLRKMEDQRRRTREELKERRSDRISLPEALIYEAYLERMDEEVNLQTTKAAQLSQKVKKTRKDLLRASQEKRIVEKLRERRQVEYTNELRRFEQGISDEASVNQFNRKLRGKP
jgi:flagellar FliJ protein